MRSRDDGYRAAKVEGFHSVSAEPILLGHGGFLG
jgi:hypothetical protein